MRQDLVQRAADGDHAAFSELAALAIANLYRIAFLVLRDRELANDAVQDALIGAWRDIRGVRDFDRFDAWLYRLTVRACHRVARRERKRAAIESELTQAHDRSFADADERLVAMRDQLDHGFHRLSPDMRAVLVLHYYLDLPQAETAAILGIPIGTMKSRLHRATQSLRAALDAHERSATDSAKDFA